MVPSHIVVLDSFPIASSGKIDHSALPPPDPDETRPNVLRAPSNDRESELLAIWQEVLKLPKIGVDDDFFELGGDSLQALTVFLEIEARLGCSLSPATIIQAPTIARLAEFIRATTNIAASQSLVPLRASGTGLPLFLVSGRVWLAIYYRHLVSNLKSDRPIYGLQPQPLDGKHRIACTVESMAADYVTEIQRIQPHGPYFLAGHSFGGQVSFEMAQQLVRAGERVSFLGLIDTGPPGGWPLVSKIARHSRKFHRVQDLRDLVRLGMINIRWGLKSIRAEVFFRRYDHWIRRGRSIPYEYRQVYHDRLCVRASCGYMPKPYPGHITVFSSAGNSDRQRAHWGPLASGGLTVLEVPAAGHADIVLPPHSKLLAEPFDACLDFTAQGV
jgi:thioesterase domain-containing protein/acyl carrier protein